MSREPRPARRPRTGGIMIRLTLRSLRARWVRFGLTSLAVVAGVAFVTGSFVLADTLRKTFDTLATSINENLDVVVRAEDPLASDDAAQALRAPLPDILVEELARVDGVARADGLISFLAAATLPDGKAMTTTGAPILGFNWTPREDGSTDVFEIIEGVGPTEADQVAIDRGAAGNYGLTVGDTLTVRGSGGDGRFTISGLLDFPDGGAGAYYLLFEPATAQRLTNLAGQFQTINIEAEDGVNQAELRDRVSAVLPPGVEAITGAQATQEFSDSFGQIINIIRTVLLVFAFVALFVAGFIINVVFNTTLGQRVRELALLRAIGARNSQVTLSVLAESLLIGLLSSIVGTLAGIGVARLLVLLITSQGGGFPESPLVLGASTWVVALVVGVGVTLLVSVFPAWRAGRVSPVTAMRDGASLFSNSIRVRTVAGIVAGVIGLVAFLGALFASFESTSSQLSLMGLGAFLLFMAATALSPLVARPLAEFLSWPAVKLYGVTGVLARGNASRNPRRTATTASALMIGVALVSMVGVLGSSFKASFSNQLRTGISADYFLTPESFTGFSPELAHTLSELDEVDQVTTFRQGSAKIAGESKSIQAVQPQGLDQIIDLDIREGTAADIPADGILVQDEVAADAGLVLGDTVSVLFPVGSADLRITGLFRTNVTGANWIVPMAIFEEHYPPDAQLDAFGGVALAEGVASEAGGAAIRSVTAEFPDVNVEDRAEFQATQEQQINQTAFIVNALLLFSLVIAALGIVITMMLAVFERTRELGLLRAVGQRVNQTRRMIRIESMVVSLFGTVLGIVMGVAFGVAIGSALPTSVINTIQIPYLQLVLTVVVAGVLGIAAGVIPAWRAGRLNILDAIAYE